MKKIFGTSIKVHNLLKEVRNYGFTYVIEPNEKKECEEIHIYVNKKATFIITIVTIRELECFLEGIWFCKRWRRKEKIK